MKAIILTFTFALLTLSPGMSQETDTALAAASENTATLTTATGGDPVTEEEFVFNIDEPFIFQEKVFIHIYDQNDKPLINAAFNSKELKENKELNNLLRKSTRFLSIDQHHYYFYEG